MTIGPGTILTSNSVVAAKSRRGHHRVQGGSREADGGVAWNLESSRSVLARVSWIEQAATRSRATVSPWMSVAANGPETDCAWSCAAEDARHAGEAARVGPRMRSAADDARHATIDAGRCHRRSPQRESRTNEIRRAVAPRLSRSEGPEKPGLQLGAIRATEARHARSARREHMKHGDPPD